MSVQDYIIGRYRKGKAFPSLQSPHQENLAPVFSATPSAELKLVKPHFR